MKNAVQDIFSKIVIAVILSFSFVGCSPNFKLDQSALSFQGQSEPVTVHGDQIGLKVNYKVAPNVFAPNGIAVVRLIQKNGDQKVELGRELLTGSKVKSVKGRKIEKKTGGDGEIGYSATYNGENTELEYWLEVTSFGDSKKSIQAAQKLLNQGPSYVSAPENTHSFITKITNGVSLLSRTAKQNTSPKTIASLFVADTIEPFEATIYFEVNKSVIRESERKRKEIEQLVNFLSKTKEILKIEVNGYASPDGEIQFNNELADERASEAGKFVVRSLKGSQGLKDIQYDLNNSNLYVQNKGTEDWKGLLKGIEFAHIPQKDRVKSIIENNSLGSAEKQAQLQNMSESWKIISEDYLPPLRRANMIINTKIAPRTFEERLDLIRAKSIDISASEMIAASEQTSDPTLKAEILESAKRLYPADHRSYNNLAVIDIENGNLQTASRNLDAAAEASPSSPEILHNQALLASLSKDWSKLGIVLKRARASGVNMPEFEALAAVVGGKYDEAINILNPKGSSALLALAQCLNRDYPSASKSLIGLDLTDPHVLYISAVIAARTKKTGSLESNLQSLVSINPQVKSSLLSDPEFALYRQEAFFTNLTK